MKRRRTVARVAITAVMVGMLGTGVGVAEAVAGPPNTVVPAKHGCGYVTTGALWWKKTVWRCW